MSNADLIAEMKTVDQDIWLRMKDHVNVGWMV